MTNKTLSQHLCKLADIPPVYFLQINMGDLDNDYQIVTNKRKCRLIADYRYDVDDEEELRNIKTLFPDFENNNDNFVRLLATILKVCDNFTFCTDVKGMITINWFHSETQLEEEYLDIGDTLITAILKSAIKLIDYPYVGNQLKQALQSENWRY